MSGFAKLRELVALARNLESEGRRLTPGSESRTVRFVEADEYRAKLLEQAETILLREMPVLPLYFYVTKSLVSPKVSGWVDNPFNVHNARDLQLAN